MKWTFAEKMVSGLKAEKLEALGLTEHSFKELTMLIVAKLITNMVHHPTAQPADLMRYITPIIGSTPLKYVKKDRCIEEKVEFDVKGTPRSITLKTYPCPEKYKKDDGIPRMVLMAHGFQSCDIFMMRYALNFYQHGFDVCIFDQRGHNEAKDLVCTMGYLEAYDVTALAEYLRKKLGDNAIIGVQGESYGSGTTYQALDTVCKYTDFAVCDCGYSDMGELAEWIEKLFFFYDKTALRNIVDELSDYDGIKFSDVRPIDHVANAPADYPVLMVHGGTDFFVPTHMTKDMYAAKQGRKRIKIYGDCFHAMSELQHKRSYKKLVTKFLKENEII